MSTRGGGWKRRDFREEGELGLVALERGGEGGARHVQALQVRGELPAPPVERVERSERVHGPSPSVRGAWTRRASVSMLEHAVHCVPGTSRSPNSYLVN